MYSDAHMFKNVYSSLSLSEKLDLQKLNEHTKDIGIKLSKFKINKDIIANLLMTLVSYIILALTINLPRKSTQS